MADRVYHYKHGWIKLDHTAAPAAGIRNRQDAAKALLGIRSLPEADRHQAAQHVAQVAPDVGASDIVPGNAHLASIKGALEPRRTGWDARTTRNRTVQGLKESPQGRQLLKTLDSFQSGGSTAIPRLRTDIEKYLNGDELPEGRKDAVANLLGTINASHVPDKPLYRGMAIPASTNDLLDHYKPGSTFNLSLASFSGDKKAAQGFSFKGAGQRVRAKHTTPVLFQLDGNKTALPIENLSKSLVFANEKEWLATGQYRVVDSKTVTRGGITSVVVSIQQVGTLRKAAAA